MRTRGPKKIKHLFLQNAVFHMLALFVAFGLKYHYSRAGSDELRWILGPTAGLVEYIGAIPFENEIGTGYVNRLHGIIIAPACAGVNFLLIAFCMTVFVGIQHFQGVRSKISWLALSAASAYLLTILVNAAYRENGIRFAEHSGMVITGCLMVMTAVFLIELGWQRLGNWIKRFRIE